jgi:carbamoylphosphate synthase large subunit
MAEEKVLIIGPGAAMQEDASWMDEGILTLTEQCRQAGKEVLFCGDEAEAPLIEADQVYLEPVKLEYLARIIRHERPAWIIPYAGGHEGMRAASLLKGKGILEECRADLYGCALLDSPMSSSIVEGETPAYLSGETLDHYHTILWLSARDHEGTICHLAEGEQVQNALMSDRDAMLVYPSFSLDDTMRQIITREVEQFMTSMKMEGVSAFVIAIRQDGMGMPQILKVRPYLDLITAFLEAASGINAAKLQADLFLGRRLTDERIEKRAGWAVQMPVRKGTGHTYVITYGKKLEEALHALAVDAGEAEKLDTNTLLARAPEGKIGVLKELLSRNEAIEKVSGVSLVKKEFLTALKKTCTDTSEIRPVCLRQKAEKERPAVLLCGCIDDQESARFMGAGMLEAAAALKDRADILILDHTMPCMRIGDDAVTLINGQVNAENILKIQEEYNLTAVYLTFAGHGAGKLAAELREHDILVKDEPLDLYEAMNAAMDVPHLIKKTVTGKEEALKTAEEIGWPVMLEGNGRRGHRAEVIASRKQAEEVLADLDEERIEVKEYVTGRMADVTAIGDGRDVYAAGIVEEMEKAGVNRMDSIAVYPRCTLTEKDMAALAEYTRVIGRTLKVKGLLRVRFVLQQDGTIRIGSVHRGYHEDIPFLEKCTGLELSASSMRVWMGDTLSICGYYGNALPERDLYCVRVPLFDTGIYQEGEAALSLNQKSGGQAFGCDTSLYRALYKGMQASGMKLSNYGTVLATIADSDKEEAVEVIRGFYDLGFNIIATGGTAACLRKNGIRTHALAKVSDGSDEIYRALGSGLVKYVINTREPGFNTSETDGVMIRRCAIENHVPVLSSLAAARALLHVLQEITLPVRPFRRNHAAGNR